MTKLHETLVIGVDGGGTGCRAAVGTCERGILARASAGPANASTDFDGAIRNVTACVAAALAESGLGPTAEAAAAAHVGLAGVVSAREAAQVAAALPFGGLTVTDDRVNVIAGALGAEDGFVVATGTGTIIARQHARIVSHVGGWGFQVSDQASGAWLGRQLLSHVLLCQDGLAAHSPLTKDVLEQFEGPSGIVRFSLSAGPSDYAAHAPRILQTAETGDEVALMLLRQGAAYLAQALRALGHQGSDPVYLTGGVGPGYAAHLPEQLQSALRPVRGSAVEGAFALAVQAATAPETRS
jgi:glucosamine kinase